MDMPITFSHKRADGTGLMIGPYEVQREDWGTCTDGLLRIRDGKVVDEFYSERLYCVVDGIELSEFTRAPKEESERDPEGLHAARQRACAAALLRLAKRIQEHLHPWMNGGMQL